MTGSICSGDVDIRTLRSGIRRAVHYVWKRNRSDSHAPSSTYPRRIRQYALKTFETRHETSLLSCHIFVSQSTTSVALLTNYLKIAIVWEATSGQPSVLSEFVAVNVAAEALDSSVDCNAALPKSDNLIGTRTAAAWENHLQTHQTNCQATPRAAFQSRVPLETQVLQQGNLSRLQATRLETLESNTGSRGRAVTS